MKIRTGFVSNSSSSSFVLFFKDIDNILSITKDDLKYKNIAFFSDGCEGTQLNYVKTSDVLKLCQDNVDKKKLQYVDVVATYGESSRKNAPIITDAVCNNINGCRILTMTIDQNSFDIYDDFVKFFMNKRIY